MATTGERQDTDLERENAELRARVGRLESELAEQAAAANRAIAAAQERAYWLDRWHLDLNALMKRRGAAEFRALLRGLRAVVRLARRAIGRG
ncbi:MAG TPA: hypothetical protein VNT32_07350 [Thermoleophilaceae bacterium]|nr:hypothetical protein [Thermoleophilaceae bacterium]